MSSYLEYRFWDCRLVELRHQVGGRWLTGGFDNPEDLDREAAKRLGEGNLFTSLHRPASREVSNSMGGSALCGDDVERFTCLLFDFDPVREPDSTSTDAQLALAKARALKVMNILRALGWPEPLQAMSGNGWHQQYRIALPNDDETRQKLKALYAGMAGEFSDAEVTFDPKVRNPGRICTLYGCVKRKGSVASLHRQSRVWLPEEWRQVRLQRFDAVVDFYARQQKTVEAYQRPAGRVEGHGDYRTLDVVGWFRAHGHYHEQAEPGKHFVGCPWEEEHSDGIDAQVMDTVVWEADGGWPTFHCSHAHCDGRTIRDVMQAWGDADDYCAEVWRRRFASENEQ